MATTSISVAGSATLPSATSRQGQTFATKRLTFQASGQPGHSDGDRKVGSPMATIDTPYESDQERERDLLEGEPLVARPRAVYQTCLGGDHSHTGGVVLQHPLASSAVDLLVAADRMGIRESTLGRSATSADRSAELRDLLHQQVPLTFFTKPAK